MRAVQAVIIACALAALAVSGACAAVDGVMRQPLPSPETLALQAILLEGGGVIPGTDVIRLNWVPPSEDADVEFVVLEYSENEDGPWDEVAAKRPDAAFHEHGSVFRSGSFHHYRVFMTRGRDETPRTEPIAVWIPGQGALERSETGQVLPRNPTATPRPDTPITPLPTVPADSSAPFLVVAPTATVPPTTIPTG